MGKPGESVVLWGIKLQIPVPARLARRASLEGLGKWMAKALVDSFAKVPPEFIARSAVQVREDARKSGLRLVGPDGREYGSGETARPFKL